jgi:hypothetical protein
MAQGDEQANAGRFDLALSSYKQADELMGVPSTRMAVARALERQGRLVEAREAAVQANRMPIAAREPQAFTAARVQAARLMIELDERIPSLVLQVQGPNGVTPEVSVNGVQISAEQLGIARRLDPASYKIIAKAPGCVDVTEEIKLAEGETRRFALSLRLVEKTPSVGPIAPKQEPRLEPAKHSTSTLTYLGFGVGALGVSVGAVSGVIVLSKTKTLKDACPNNSCPESQDGQLHSARSIGWVSTLSFGVGIVGLGVGLVSVMGGNGRVKKIVSREYI